MAPANSHVAKTAALKASATKAKTSVKKTKLKLQASQRAHDQTRRKLHYAKETAKAHKAQMHALTHEQRIASMILYAANAFYSKLSTSHNAFVDQAQRLQSAQAAVTSLRGAFSGRYRQDEINEAIHQWFHTQLFALLPADAYNQVMSARRSSGRLP